MLLYYFNQFSNYYLGKLAEWTMKKIQDHKHNVFDDFSGADLEEKITQMKAEKVIISQKGKQLKVMKNLNIIQN